MSPYEVGGAYYAGDGNHRVSVPRFHGVEWIDVVVTRLRVPLAADRAQDGTCTERQGHGGPEGSHEASNLRRSGISTQRLMRRARHDL